MTLLLAGCSASASGSASVGPADTTPTDPTTPVTIPTVTTPGTTGVGLTGLKLVKYMLFPAFDPTISDYYVRCKLGDNQTTVEVTTSASSGVTLELAVDGASTTTVSPAAPTSIVLKEN